MNNNSDVKKPDPTPEEMKDICAFLWNNLASMMSINSKFVDAMHGSDPLTQDQARLFNQWLKALEEVESAVLTLTQPTNGGQGGGRPN